VSKPTKPAESGSSAEPISARVLVDCHIDGKPARANSVVTIRPGTYADVTDSNPEAVAYALSLQQ